MKNSVVVEFPFSRVRNGGVPLALINAALDDVLGGAATWMQGNCEKCAITDPAAAAILLFDRCFSDATRVSLYLDGEPHFQCYVRLDDRGGVMGIFENSAADADRTTRNRLYELLNVASNALKRGTVQHILN